ncbi:MAG: DUF1080 domain-containing protein [Akkermansiaceae bacterium]|nr:DUF1080 domain-containing protein [Akkermansiaceae bacterium]
MIHPTQAAEGISTDWTQVSKADLELMGDYEGTWLDAPQGHYFEINKPVAAQIMNVRDGEYAIRFTQQLDARADPYFEGVGKLEGDAIVFEANGWKGRASGGVLSGIANNGGKEVKFELKRVARLSPSLGAKPPEGAIVLFDGKNFDQWTHGGGRAVSWHLLDNGAMEVRSAHSQEDREKGIGGDIETKQAFGDCRIHLEFRYPVEPGKAGQGRGNSGFFFQGGYEVQILNSYGLHGYWNECGALYKFMPPKVNAARPPMQWQTYDVEYTASVWKDGKKVSPPRITVRHNGVLIHDDQEIAHITAHAFAQRTNEPQGPGPIRLQDHSNAIQFRNIWILPGKSNK